LTTNIAIEEKATASSHVLALRSDSKSLPIGTPKSGFSIFESIVTTLIFAIIILVFCVGSVRNWSRDDARIALQERRTINPKPKLTFTYDSLRAFPSAFDAFYNDRVAFRNPLVTRLSLMRYRLFETANSKLVLVGKDGWLFFRATGGEETARNAPLFDEPELNRWATLLENRRAWLEARGIKYFVYVVPNSTSIYPEELPDGFRVNSPTSRFDQLVERLRTTSKLKILDLRPKMLAEKQLAEKQDKRIYFKTDTHWNSLGAFIGAKQVIDSMRELFPTMPPLTKADIHLVPYHFDDGDLASLLGLHGIIAEETVRQDPNEPTPWRLSNEYKDFQLANELINRKPFATVCSNPKLPTALCLRDSYMVAQKDFLSRRFRKISYYWTAGFPIPVIEHEKPDVVIQEIAERFLAAPDYMSNPPNIGQ